MKNTQRPPGGKGPSAHAKDKDKEKSKDKGLPASSSKPRHSDNPNVKSSDPNPKKQTGPDPPAAHRKPSPDSKRHLQHQQLPLSHLSTPPPRNSSPSFPPPPPTYGFHMLERRTIVLADGSVRSYFALPPDYPMEPTDNRFFSHGGPIPALERPNPPSPYWPGDGPSSLKRKFGEDDEFARARQHLSQYGGPGLSSNGVRPGEFGDYIGRGRTPPRRGSFEDDRLPKQPKFGGLDERFGDGPSFSRKDNGGEDGARKPIDLDVDPEELQKAYLNYAKIIYENGAQKKKLLDDGKSGSLSCIVCSGRPSKDFPDVHRLIMHSFTCMDSRINHLGLHKALCVLMGWNFAIVPDNGKAYQSLSPKEAAANREELIVWPPHVVMQNTSTGKRKEGRMEGIGNKDMDNWLREAGFGSGKGKSMYGKEGHLGITVVKFAESEAGLKEAERLADFLSKNNRGREGWALAQASQATHGSEGNPLITKLDEKGEEKRIFYGYVAIAPDLDILEFDLRRKLSLRCRSEFDSSSE